MPKNGNITGQVFDEGVIKQIEARQEFLGVREKTDAHIIYANNSNAFLRLGSSINISGSEQLKDRGLNESYIGDKLAKACVLFGGTVGVDDKLSPLRKFGIYNSSYGDPISTIAEYGWGGIGSRGFVPMPIIDSADVGFYNRGALQKASVKIKVFSLEQLQIFDLLYFRIGYTMLLEWGHNVWIDNDKKLQNRTEFVTEPFQKFFGNDQNVTQQDIIKAIQFQRIKDTYNYDAMLGKVTNFTWKFNDDGSYDIDLKLIGLGDIIESLKINTATTTNTGEKTPSQLGVAAEANLTKLYASADVADERADKNAAAVSTALDEKITGINEKITKLDEEFKQLTKKIPNSQKDRNISPWNTADNDTFEVLKDFRTAQQSGINVRASTDEDSNINALGSINTKLEDFITFDTDINDAEGFSDVAAIRNAIKSNFTVRMRQILRAIQDLIQSVTTADIKSVSEASEAAEAVKKANAAKRKGLDAASQSIKKTKEINQLSPVTSIESKNKTKFNYQLWEWRQNAISETDKENLYKLTLRANSSDSSATGTSTLSLDFYYVRLGIILEWIEKNLLIYDSTKKIKNAATGEEESNPIFKIDYDVNTNYCLSFPSQVSADPKVCIIPSIYPSKSSDASTQSNISWNILPELKAYFVDDNPYAGKIMNIFINIDHTAGVLDKNLDSNGKVNLLKFLTDLMNTINDALGNVNKIQPQFDSENNTFKLLEGSSIEGLEKLINDKEKAENNMAIFQTYGIGTDSNPNSSFLTNVDFQVQLPPNMAAMATISAQAGGNIVGENATGLSKLNVGLMDRLISVKLDKASIEGAKSGKDDPLSVFTQNLQLASKVISDVYTNKMYAKESVESLRSTNRDLALYLTGNDAINHKMPSPFFIPFNLSLNMKGLSGMRNYERFGITENILPYSYRSYNPITNTNGAGVIDFLIKGISHKIDNNSWETKIESLTVSSNRKWKAKK